MRPVLRLIVAWLVRGLAVPLLFVSLLWVGVCLPYAGVYPISGTVAVVLAGLVVAAATWIADKWAAVEIRQQGK